jgi:hypothetical protein
LLLVSTVPASMLDRRSSLDYGLPTPSLARRRLSRRSVLVRVIRTTWWPRFMLGGAVLAVVGATALRGTAQTVAVLVGALVVVFAIVRAINSDDFVRQEPPVPPGGGGLY